MAVSLSVCLFAANSIPSPGGTGRCQYTGQSVRALPIRVFTVGKKRLPAVQLLVGEYTSKLRHYCAVEDVQVRSNPRNAREKQAQIVDEDMAVMNLIRPDDWVVLLDEQGIDIESEEMAELIGGAADKGASKLSFCIGGPYGHGPKLRERANISIKLSSLVLNHQIALVVLMEQLYSWWSPGFWVNDTGDLHTHNVTIEVVDNPEGAKVPSLAFPPSYLMLLLPRGVDSLCSVHRMHS